MKGLGGWWVEGNAWGWAVGRAGMQPWDGAMNWQCSVWAARAPRPWGIGSQGGLQRGMAGWARSTWLRGPLLAGGVLGHHPILGRAGPLGCREGQVCRLDPLKRLGVGQLKYEEKSGAACAICG